MDREHRIDLVGIVVEYAVAVTVVMILYAIVGRPDRLAALAARLRRPDPAADDTMETLALIQVRREISMMEHGCDD